MRDSEECKICNRPKRRLRKRPFKLEFEDNTTETTWKTPEDSESNLRVFKIDDLRHPSPFMLPVREDSFESVFDSQDFETSIVEPEWKVKNQDSLVDTLNNLHEKFSNMCKLQKDILEMCRTTWINITDVMKQLDEIKEQMGSQKRQVGNLYSTCGYLKFCINHLTGKVRNFERLFTLNKSEYDEPSGISKGSTSSVISKGEIRKENSSQGKSGKSTVTSGEISEMSLNPDMLVLQFSTKAARDGWIVKQKDTLTDDLTQMSELNIRLSGIILS